ncbi:KHDRBS3 [Mytilus coruscus]|uniref:KHDRBS3 n=1 Tax=Mytilus coruscus TaxID=42192 RepID=A0A6J8CTD4_MYTCO|nr:KHDRBS3 [Mytilus coruscus]
MAQQQQQQETSLGEASSSLVEAMKSEISQLDANCQPHGIRLLNDEVKRIEQGGPKKQVPLVEAHHNRPQAVALKVKIPVSDFPKFNFVGKLLGPKGMSLKRLQEETGTKMSILGKGSMRDKGKEDEMRKEGGKYAHLNEDLHLLIEVYSEISDCYARLSHALSEVQKYLTPEYNDEITQQQMQEMNFMSNGSQPARGGGRGGAPPGRGAPRGAPAPRARGAPRGAPVGRGAPRGVAGRGAPVGRGRAAPPPVAPVAQSLETAGYDDYGVGGYEGYADPYARDPYAESGYGAGDTQYFDYGHGASATASYDETYGKPADNSWATGATAGKAPPTGRGGRGQYRPHPYGAGRGVKLVFCKDISIEIIEVLILVQARRRRE